MELTLLNHHLYLVWVPVHYSGHNTSFENVESHNSLIDWATQAGIFGTIPLVLLMIYLAVLTIKNRAVELWVGLFALLAFAQLHLRFETTNCFGFSSFGFFFLEKNTTVNTKHNSACGNKTTEKQRIGAIVKICQLCAVDFTLKMFFASTCGWAN